MPTELTDAHTRWTSLVDRFEALKRSISDVKKKFEAAVQQEQGREKTTIVVDENGCRCDTDRAWCTAGR